MTAWALLDLAARNKETVLWNAYLKAKRQTERGALGQPAAYVIPTVQHDRLTAVKLVNKLLIQGVEVQRATRSFSTAEGMQYPEGSYVVPMAQPKMGLIRYLLGRTFYPDNEWTRTGSGEPIRPYDMATDTMFEFMGVRVDPVAAAVTGNVQKVGVEVRPEPKQARGSHGYWFDGRLNDSFRAVNLLIDKGVAVRRVDRPAQGLRRGDFTTAPGSEAMIAAIAKETGVDFLALNGEMRQDSHELKRLRLAMYQRYRRGNMDEGWTRWLLEQFGYPYTALMDAEIKKGSLRERYDTIVLPDDSTAAITGERAEPRIASGRPPETYPPEYRSGIGRRVSKRSPTLSGRAGRL